MAKAKGKKGSVKVQDMEAKKNPKGGATTQAGSFDTSVSMKTSVPTK